MTRRTETYETEVTLAVKVTYRYYPGCSGYREPGGMQLEPDEPASFEIESARLSDGTEISLDLLDLERLEREIAEGDYDPSDDRDYAYESRRDRMYSEGSL